MSRFHCTTVISCNYEPVHGRVNFSILCCNAVLFFSFSVQCMYSLHGSCVRLLILLFLFAASFK